MSTADDILMLAKVLEALRDLLTQFPTDDDLERAGWSNEEIEAACAAHDRGRAAFLLATGGAK